MAAILRLRLENQEIHSYTFEGMTLICGDGMRYNADFMVIERTGEVTLVEVKGAFIRRSGLQAFQAAKKAHPYFTFQLCQLDNGEWRKLA